MKSFKYLLIVVITCAILFGGALQAKSKKTITGVVNINTANIAELMMLPGIGKSKAQAIIDFRHQQPFKTTEDIKSVKGVGDKLYASISPHITVSGQTTALIDVQKTKSTLKKAPGGAGKAK